MYDKREYRDREYSRDMEDERNPYGSRGGYVSSRRGGDHMDERDYGDMRRGSSRGGRDRMDERDYGDMRRGGNRRRDMEDERTFRMDYEDGRRGRDYEYDGYTRDFRDYNDYGHGYLSNKELQKWQNKLCKDLDQQECEMFKYEHIIHQAEEMNIMFDRYTKEEFYTTVLMMYTDYKKTCANNIPMYISLAKEFLEDDDARVRYGEKLAAYYDNIADV